MKPFIKIFFAVSCFCFSAGSSAHSHEDIYNNLSDSQHFRTYPYIDKAFRYESNKNYTAALAEVNKALKIAPNHIQYIKYAYMLSVKLGRPNAELIALLKRIPIEKRGDLLFDLRLQESKQGKLYAPYDVNNIAKNLTINQMHEWYIIHIYNVERRHGKSIALTWSLEQNQRYKPLKAKRYEAYRLTEAQRDPEAITILEKIKNNNQANQKDLQYLAMSYLAIQENHKALETANLLTDKAGKQLIYTTYAESLVHNAKLFLARIQLNNMHRDGMLPLSLIPQRDYLNSLTTGQLQRIQSESVMMDGCMKQSLAYQSDGEIAKARYVFRQCKPNETPISWLTLAVELDLYSSIEKVRFDAPELQSKQRDILNDHYKKTKKWHKEINLLSQANIRFSERYDLAYAYTQIDEYRSAADILFSLYKQSKLARDLELATYNMLKVPQSSSHTAEMLNYGIHNEPSSFLNSSVLVNRTATLAYENVTLFSPASIQRLNTKLSPKAKILPETWLYQEHCQVLVGKPSFNVAQEHFLNQAKAYCLAPEDSIAAADLYVGTMSQQSLVSDNIIVAKWYAEGNAYSDSYPYWQDVTQGKVSLRSLDLYTRYLYITTLSETNYIDQANTIWEETPFDKNNVDWWVLGSLVAYQLGDHQLAEQRLNLALKHTQSPIIIQMIAQRAVKEGDQETLEELIQYAKATDQTGDMNAALGYSLAVTDTKRAEAAFYITYQYSKYQNDLGFISEYASLSSQNENKVKASDLYKLAIDQTNEDDSITAKKQKEYLQNSHHNLNLGWKYTIAGWIGGNSNTQSIPGFSDKLGDYFAYGEAKYYFAQPWIDRSALSISALSVGGFNTDSDNSTELDLGYQVQPFAHHSSFIKLGVKQSLVGDSRYTLPYVRISSDVFSNDDWSKAWRGNRNHWLYQNLYLDGLAYLNTNDGYSLYGRYELGETFKIIEKNQQRLTPYGFAQWSNNKDEYNKAQNGLAGLGVSWGWNWHRTHYNGFNVNSELGLEWQHTLSSSGSSFSGDALLLRFSSFF